MYQRKKKTSVATLVVIMIAGLLTLLPATQVEAQAGNDRTVSPGESIQAALDEAESGDTIIVKKGVYNEALVIRTSGITLLGEKGATVSPGDSRTECEFFGDVDAICIAADFFTREDGRIDSREVISDVTVSGFAVRNVRGAGIGVVRGENITITKNNVTAPGCDGYYAILTDGFEISRNVVKKSGQVLGFCNGVSVLSSSNGTVARNKALNGAGMGLLLNSVVNVKVDRNKVVGNCNGISLNDDPDRPLELKNVKVTRNTVSRNTKSCKIFEMFGVDAEFGGVGIGVIGGDKIQLKRNKVTKNVLPDELQLPTAGVLLIDNVNPLTGDFFSPLGRVTVAHNTIRDNSAGGVEVDLSVLTQDGKVKVNKNTCGVSIPDPALCGG